MVSVVSPRSAKDKSSSAASTKSKSKFRDDDAHAAAIETVHAHCAVYTSPRVAEAILDRVGWVEDANLLNRRLLEPSCGEGAFLLPAVQRLLSSARMLRLCREDRLVDSIRTFEFDRDTALSVRAKVRKMLVEAGLGAEAAKRVATAWVSSEDFLLAQDLPAFTDIVGNPPYMRWSKVPTYLRALYEARLPSYASRGDLCLAFVCRSVELLDGSDGRVALLCADRWLRCAYGAEARSRLDRDVYLVQHLEVRDVPVFVGSRKVEAHAAVTVLQRQHSGAVAVSSATSLDDLCAQLQPSSGRVTPATGVVPASRLAGQGGAILVHQGLATTFEAIVTSGRPMESVGVSVRCGMALGHATSFVIENDEDVRVESDRLVPWIRTRDLSDADTVTASAKFIDVWDAKGDLVTLAHYPLLRARLQKDRNELMARACVRDPKEWYRTIDKPHRERLNEPKILVAGMSRFARVGMSKGGAQPSNALYSVTSTQWPLSVLFALFRCGLLDLFATVLSPRFAGDVKRFDGNLLRQVRLPEWSAVAPGLRSGLEKLSAESATPRPDVIVELFSLSGVAHFRAISTAIARS